MAYSTALLSLIIIVALEEGLRIHIKGVKSHLLAAANQHRHLLLRILNFYHQSAQTGTRSSLTQTLSHNTNYRYYLAILQHNGRLDPSQGPLR